MSESVETEFQININGEEFFSSVGRISGNPI